MGHGIYENMNLGLLQKVLLVALLGQIMCGNLRLSVKEEQEKDTMIGSIATDYLPPYQLLRQDYVRVDQTTGDLYTTEHKLDRETLCPTEQEGDCTVTDEALVNPEQEVVKLTVVVEDINDNMPYFEETEIHLNVSEDVAVGTSFLLDDQAKDLDAGSNGELRYHLEGADRLFGVIEKGPSLVVVVQRELDRETQTIHRMTLVATDGGATPLSATATLVVTVTDVNDNCPLFDPDSPRTATLPGDSPRDTVVAQVKASDRDLGHNAAITYYFSPQISDTAKALFRLDRHTGLIILSGDIKSDSSEQHVLKVIAGGPHCPPADAEVIISVHPVASPEPVIKIKFIAEHENQTILLQENEPPTVLAILELSGSSSVKGILSIEAGDMPFSLKPRSSHYLLSTSKPLDFEMHREYHVSIVISDAQGKRLRQKEVIKVLLVDVNDNAPQFQHDHYQIYVEENNEPGASLLQVKATDADSQLNGKVFYRLSHNTAGIFSIDHVTGQLSVLASLDREQQQLHTLTVLARDYGSPRLEASASVAIRVLDQNDNQPAFLTPHFIFFISESVPRLAQVGKVGVTDADEGDNGSVADVRVVNSSGPFAMDLSRGALRCTAEVDRETQERYELLLLASDGGSPPLYSTARVTIFVEDVNDNRPQVILPSSNLSCLTVSPATVAGTTVTKIYATDEDSGMNSDITYYIAAREPAQHSPFQIDSRSGNISLAQRLVGRDYGMHHLFIVVSDGGKPAPLQTTVWINLLVNETVEQCHLSRVPVASPSTGNPPRSPNSSESVDPCVKNAWLILLVGLGAMALSAFMLLIAVVLCVKQKNMKCQMKPCDQETEIPLKLRSDY